MTPRGRLRLRLCAWQMARGKIAARFFKVKSTLPSDGGVSGEPKHRQLLGKEKTTTKKTEHCRDVFPLKSSPVNPPYMCGWYLHNPTSYQPSEGPTRCKVIVIFLITDGHDTKQVSCCASACIYHYTAKQHPNSFILQLRTKNSD